MDYKKYMESANTRTHFAVKNGMRLIELREGYARSEMPITQDSCNYSGGLHGGALFTLADFTAGHAVNAYGIQSVTLDASISYFRAASGGKVIAEAKQKRHGKNISFMEVEIFDESGRQLCEVLLTFYTSGAPVVLSENAN